MRHTLGVGDVALEVLSQKRILKEHSSHHHQRDHSADPGGEPRSQGKTTQRWRQDESRVSRVADDAVGTAVNDAMAAIGLESYDGREEAVFSHGAVKHRQ